MPAPLPRPRARELGLTFGALPTGAHNAITDVPGVRVGHVTVWHGDGDEPIARTGVTAIVPDAPAEMFRRPMAAAPAVLNGAGELTGSMHDGRVGRARDTHPADRHSVGRAGRTTAWSTRCTPPAPTRSSSRSSASATTRGSTSSSAGGSPPITCARHWPIASDGPVAEGVVGAGTGMVTMGFKAGIGTSSRVLDGLGTVGVLLLCNFGGRRQLRIGGVPVGELLPRASDVTAAPTLDTGGSCLGVVMTDLPLDARQLQRVARRVGMGLARMGSVAHHGSGDIFCAVSTTNRLAARRRPGASASSSSPTAR